MDLGVTLKLRVIPVDNRPEQVNMPPPKQLALGDLLSRKHSGAYFTPQDVVQTLVGWAVRRSSDRMLDPACGDGRFLALHRKSVGVEQDQNSAAEAIARAPWALIHEGDFFSWAANTKERFECAAGNPPFIRYQQFNGAVRASALQLCRSIGAEFSGLTSSWAPFLVAAASLLKQGGRMAFVVPAEIGHAPYAAPLLEYFVGNFSRVRVIAIRDKFFPALSEDCWLLFAEGFGGQTQSIALSAVDRFFTDILGATESSVSVADLRKDWKLRLRPFLLPASVRETYLDAARHKGSCRLRDIADVGIGYVTGANDFFHLRPSAAARLSIPDTFLTPSVRSGKSLPLRSLTSAVITKWKQNDEQMLLLKLPKTGKLPPTISKYLDSEAGREARKAYKCRVRDPWYAVPDVRTPDFFLTYMSGLSPSLVSNEAGCTCTNSVHAVQFINSGSSQRVVGSWQTPFVQLSCEIEGHPLGGGMLKLEPGEAGQVLIPPETLAAQVDAPQLSEALAKIRSWRHYDAS